MVLLFVCVCLWFRFCREGWVWVGCRSPIAQLVERATVNRKVAGSNPAGRVAFEFSCTNTHSQLRSLACHDMAWHGMAVLLHRPNSSDRQLWTVLAAKLMQSQIGTPFSNAVSYTFSSWSHPSVYASARQRRAAPASLRLLPRLVTRDSCVSLFRSWSCGRGTLRLLSQLVRPFLCPSVILFST